jgi:NitT/TauT family transport system permease protein
MTWRSALALVLPPLVPLLVLTGATEVLVRTGVIRSFLVPPPSLVLLTLVDFSRPDAADLWRSAAQTAGAALAGFALSAAVGLLTAVALSSSAWVRRAFYPYAVFFQTVPIIAIAPLLVIWIGYGTPTVITSAFIVSVFPVIANALAGLVSTDPALRDLFQLYGAGPVAAMWKLRLPSALPSILTGLRVAGGLAVIGAIVGEFITMQGLGGVIQVSRQLQRVDKIFAGLLLAAMLGIGLFAAIGCVSRLSLRHWHASEQGMEQG